MRIDELLEGSWGVWTVVRAVRHTVKVLVRERD